MPLEPEDRSDSLREAGFVVHRVSSDASYGLGEASSSAEGIGCWLVLYLTVL